VDSVCASNDTTCICTDIQLAVAIQACAGMSCSIKEILIAMNVTDTMCQRPRRDKSHQTTVGASLVGGLAVLAVVLRTIEARLGGHFGWHDACALGAGICAIPFNAVQLLIGPAGFGRDTWTVPTHNLVLILKVRCGVRS
jgi:hypothetical protein